MTDLFPDRIETERLVLEALTTETADALALYELVREGAPHIDEVTEYLTWDPHETPKETREFLEAVTDRREAGEGGTYTVRPRESDPAAVEDASAEADDEIAGLTGIGVDWDRRTATLGIWLRKGYWGRGYSGERAAALFEVAFERLDLDAVVVTVQEGNEKSRAAVDDYVRAHGGHREGLLQNFQTDQDGAVVDAHRYTVTAEEYRDSADEGS